ncbi:MAG: methionyl-tRNA formyltransferase [Mariniblastus sp.]|nr:methionyl-tRNA formyltransferase [Mariniblastus sp.]
MRIVFFGTGPFAIPACQWICQSEHVVQAVVTRPILDSGKRRKTSENPVRDLAESLGLAVMSPTDVNSPTTVRQLSELEPDLFFVCDYGQILSRECLAAARLGGINLHGSLLPKYRGAAPVNWAIYHGETETGVTVIHMSAKLDAGPCLAVDKTTVVADETAAELEPRLAQLGVRPVAKAIEMLHQWDGQSPLGVPQDAKRASKAPRLKKQSGLIDWRESAEQIFNQIRAFQPWPGSFTQWQGQNREPVRVILHQVAPVESTGGPPGIVLAADNDQLTVQTGQGGIQILSLQPAGKRKMDGAAFVRGYQPQVGDLFKNP